MAQVVEVRPVEVGVEMTFEMPSELMRYLVEKGSVAVDGVSLTVSGLSPPRFTVALIPFTLEVTDLGSETAGRSGERRGRRHGQVRGGPAEGGHRERRERMSETTEQEGFASIEEALEEIQAGRMVIVVDDADRENEGDFIMAAEKVTPEAINFMATHGRGSSACPARAIAWTSCGCP